LTLVDLAFRHGRALDDSITQYGFGEWIFGRLP
jgi:hypothetical protein